MLHRILKRLSGRSSIESPFEKQWREGVENQHDAMTKAGYYPIPGEALEESNRRYRDPSHRSLMFSDFNLNNQDLIFPVRALYATGATLMTSTYQPPANPSLAIESACQFRLAAMEAALKSTPDDLLILLDCSFILPLADSWEQNLEWREKEFAENYILGLHSLSRHAAALFLKRIDTPEADFLAFKEAAMVLRNFGLFNAETDKNHEVEVQLGYVISDLFPSLRIRERNLLERKSRLTWREEGAKNPVVPEERIGVDGFA